MNRLALLGLACAVALGARHPAPERPKPRAPGPGPSEVHVAAAVSLTEALQGIAAVFEREHGVRVVLNLAGSNTLARQIAAGATADLFISADEAQMEVVARAAAIERRVDLLGNELAVLVPDDSTATVATVTDLQQPSVRRIALGDPAAVPVGVYARAFLERAGLWRALEPKIVPVASVRAALAAVDSGNVDAAIVYRTDAKVARRARVAVRVSGPQAPRIVYPAALLSNGPAAAAFFDFLRSRAAAAIFERHGFTPLAS